LTATLFGSTQEESGETFPLWSSGRDSEASFAKSSGESPALPGGACGYESGPSTSPSAVSSGPNGSGQAISVVFSEIAWMGTEEGAQYEWIELANVSNAPADIGGWSVVDKDEQIQKIFPQNVTIPAGGFFLLARSADRVGNTHADARYAGNLKNEDEVLRLFDASCNAIDEVIAAPKWPAGESAERRTMERNLATRTWHTSAKVGGTPRAANTSGWFTQVNHPATTTSVPAQTSIATASTTPTSTVQETPVSAPSTQGIVVISEVMAGKDGAANWDFVELYNPSVAPVSLTGWSMKKRTASGSESSLVSVSAKDPSASFEGKTIPAGGYFLLANTEGYTGVPAADVKWPKSYTLAYTNNAVVFYDANGAKVSEVSWTEIPKGKSYARVNDSFVLGNPTPRAAP
ncbi:MAG: lamin tail domain-containing protein, partial [Candidatus Jorgensenbacteria bacterium]|nr:lamin tail domain-containing protein [Candidatus Jorgensenbacteria bacterium]